MGPTRREIMYRCNNRTFETITEAKQEARAALIGRAHDKFEMIYEWQAGVIDVRDGFWCPVARAEYKGNKIVVPR